MDPHRNRFSQTGNAAKNDRGGQQTAPKSHILQAHGYSKSSKKFSMIGSLQNYIDESSDCYLGLEYVLEIRDFSAKGQGFYYCVLCNVRCFFSRKAANKAALSHLLALPHREKYLEQHFPTAFKLLCDIDRNKRRIIATEIAEDIEKNFGRMKIMHLDIREYEQNRKHYHLVARKGKHFEETPTLNYESYVMKHMNIQGEAEPTQVSEMNKGKKRKNLPPQASVFDRLSQNNIVDNSDDIPKRSGRLPDDVMEQIEQDYKRYSMKPDEHPQYSEEWSKFWKAKYTQLNSKGLNLSSYDFEPEWQTFWNERLIQLYVEAKENAAKMKAASKPQVEQVVNSENVQEPKQRPESVNSCSSTIKDVENNLISVLRLLVALEDHLGSLAPKVMDLMSQALMKENEKEKSSEELMDANNCILLKSVCEKLKGRLQIGLVSGSLENAFGTVITNIEKLVETYNKGKRKENEILKGLESIPGLSKVHRNKILEEICRHTRGKAQFTEEELTKYITDLIKEMMSKTPSASNVSSSFEQDVELVSDEDPFSDYEDIRSEEDNSFNEVTKEECRLDGIPITSGTSSKSTQKNEESLFTRANFVTVSSDIQNTRNFSAPSNFTQSSNKLDEYSLGSSTAPQRTNYSQDGYKEKANQNCSSRSINYMRDRPRKNLIVVETTNLEEKKEQKKLTPQRIEESKPSAEKFRNDRSHTARWNTNDSGGEIEFDSRGYLKTFQPSSYQGGLYPDHRREASYPRYSDFLSNPSKFRRLE